MFRRYFNIFLLVFAVTPLSSSVFRLEQRCTQFF
uniref:Uncharacterized protein n=1 Tax=Rhizophora mucronata TaxID=61149 RepID=A0A2P2Q911_RHIMU